MNHEQTAQQIKDFSMIPDSFLQDVEISESDFLNEVKEDKQAVKQAEPGAAEPGPVTNDFSIDGPSIADASPSPIPQSVNIGNLFSADIATEVFDTITNGTARATLKAFDIPSTPNEFAFTAKEKKTLEPILGECLKTLNINFRSPWEALFYIAGIIVTTKIVVNKGGEIAAKINGETKKAEKKKTAPKKAEKEPEEKDGPSEYMVKKYGAKKAAELWKKKHGKDE